MSTAIGQTSTKAHAERVSVAISPNFIEFFHPNKKQRYYLPLKNLKDSFKDYFQDFQSKNISEILISCRLSEKILQTKLGGSVAQILTQGFEDLISIRQPVLEKFLTLSPTKPDSLGSSELVFTVNERIGTDGNVEKALDIEELKSLTETLKTKKVEKVVLNFLNSVKNPIHIEQATQHLKENGFTVFNQMYSAEENELSMWRKNLLDACLYGVQKEIDQDILTAVTELGLPPEIIRYSRLDSADEGASSLNYGWLYSMQKASDKTSFVLYLGLENWYLINSNSLLNEQPTTWGNLAICTPFYKKLKTQPTSELLVDRHNQTYWGEEKSFDPGPMCFGRSLRFLLLDAIYSAAYWDCLWINNSGKSKVETALTNYCKNLQMTRKEFLKDIFSSLIERICIELSLTLNTGEVALCGTLAPILEPYLKQKLPSLKFHKVTETDFAESWSLWNQTSI